MNGEHVSGNRVIQRGDIVSVSKHGSGTSRLGVVVSTPDYYDTTKNIQAALISTEGTGYGYAVELLIQGLGNVICDNVRQFSSRRYDIRFIETVHPAEVARILGKINTLFN
jgi:mRNA-degrading endonuclease toxin of MazEF toxin-antitoxin module